MSLQVSIRPVGLALIVAGCICMNSRNGSQIYILSLSGRCMLAFQAQVCIISLEDRANLDEVKNTFIDGKKF